MADTGREPFPERGIGVLSDDMRDCALKTAAMAMLLAAGAPAQDTATFNVPETDGGHSYGAAKLAYYKIPSVQVSNGAGKKEVTLATVRTMPEYRVTEFRAEVFRQRDLYTKRGMEDLSFQRHPGLMVGNFFKLNENLAYETFLRDDWNSTKADYWDMAHAMALGGDAREGRMITKAVDDQDAWMRAEADGAASAPALGRFQIASAEAGSRLLELPEETIDIPLVKRRW
jgi:hypothetical protein